MLLSLSSPAAGDLDFMSQVLVFFLLAFGLINPFFLKKLSAMTIFLFNRCIVHKEEIFAASGLDVGNIYTPLGLLGRLPAAKGYFRIPNLLPGPVSHIWLPSDVM